MSWGGGGLGLSRLRVGLAFGQFALGNLPAAEPEHYFVALEAGAVAGQTAVVLDTGLLGQPPFPVIGDVDELVCFVVDVEHALELFELLETLDLLRLDPLLCLGRVEQFLAVLGPVVAEVEVGEVSPEHLLGGGAQIVGALPRQDLELLVGVIPP